MSLSQTKRAIRAREWRTGLREKRRFNTLISDFISVKYPDIYDEAWQFYNSLNKRHSQKHNLTKTKEYKRWKSEIVNNQTSESEDDNAAEPAGEIISEVVIDTDQSNEQTAAMAIEQVDGGEATEADGNILQAAAMAIEQVDGGEATEADGNILQAAAEGLIPDNLDNLDNIIDDIIMDLQQDDVLRDYLNAERNGEILRPQYEEEDEGIGLNLETELEAIIEPFDYELDVEGFDY